MESIGIKSQFKTFYNTCNDPCKTQPVVKMKYRKIPLDGDLLQLFCPAVFSVFLLSSSALTIIFQFTF